MDYELQQQNLKQKIQDNDSLWQDEITTALLKAQKNYPMQLKLDIIAELEKDHGLLDVILDYKEVNIKVKNLDVFCKKRMEEMQQKNMLYVKGLQLDWQKQSLELTKIYQQNQCSYMSWRQRPKQASV